MQTLTKQRTAGVAYTNVLAEAETIKNDAAAALEVMSPSDSCRQGDVYVIMLDEAPTKASDFAGRQLAPGSTQGSRHVAVGNCELYTPDDASATAILNRLIPATKNHQQFFGPVIQAAEPVTIEHPEHGDRTLPVGTYLCTYQRAYADEVRRAQD